MKVKKIFHFIYRKVVHESTPVVDVVTKRKEIATHVELFGFVVNRSYKAI